MVELDKLPMYEIQTLYYLLWKEKEAESKLTDEEKAGAALGKVIEDNM